MPVSNPILEKVFLALRTNFIPGHSREHITLRYYDEVRWETLLKDAERLDKKLPATIVHKGRHNWNANGNTFTGLLVSSPDSMILDHLNMPHITVPKRILDRTDLADIQPLEVVDTLWVSKKVNGQFVWSKVSDAPIGVDLHDYGILS